LRGCFAECQRLFSAERINFSAHGFIHLDERWPDKLPEHSDKKIEFSIESFTGFLYHHAT